MEITKPKATKLSLKERQGRRRIIMEKENHGCNNTGTVNVCAKAAKRRFEQVQIAVDDSIPKSKRKKRLPSSAYNTRSSLHAAIEKEDIQLIQYLLSQGTSVNITDKLQRTALHAAASNGNAAIVKLFLDYKAEVCVYDFERKSPLHFAAESGNSEIIELLLKAPPVNGRSAGINEKTRYKETPLHIVALKGHTQLVKHMIRLGADVNARNILGSTPLRYAAAAGNAETVKELLLYGANIDAEKNYNPLTAAIHDDYEFYCGKPRRNKLARKLSQSRILKQIEVIDELMKAGAIFNYTGKMLPLYYAVLRGIDDIVKKLLDYGAEVDPNDLIEGCAPLHMAAKEQASPKICKMLIDAGADVNRLNIMGHLPIQLAVHYHKKTKISMLLAAGSDINVKSRRENGLFLISMLWGKPDCELLNILFECGLDFNAQHRDGRNAFHYIRWSYYKNLLAILIDCNPDLNAVSKKYSTPLVHWFVDNENGEFEKEIEFLIMTMVKMECSSELKINDVNMRVIENFFLDFYVQCKREVKDMKSTKVLEDISFFDFLNKPMHKLVDYCKNKELINYLDSGVYKQFENYSCLIELRMRAAMKKHLLLEKSVKVLKELVMPINLPYLVSLRILGCLNSCDLKSVSCCK